jgi:hypothetical protein
MKIQGRKVAVLLLAVVICLTGLAVGYGHWSETLQINGTVTTLPGGVCVEFTQFINLDPPGTNDWTVDGPVADLTTNWTQLWKDVGTTEVELQDIDPDWCGAERAVITITNAYPCYATKVTLVIGNTGDVPVQIIDVTITPVNFTLYDPLAEIGEIDMVLWNWEGDILYPGQGESGTLDLHVMQEGVEQGTTYVFVIDIVAEQYVGP